MDDKTYITNMSCTNTQVLSDLTKPCALTCNISSQEAVFHAFGQCLLHKSQCDTKHHDELTMHSSITTNKSVVKYNIIDECCIFLRYALTKIQKVKPSHFI